MVMDRFYRFNEEIQMIQIDKTGKRPKCPLINEWKKKMWYTYTGILLSHKKITPFAAIWINLEIIILSFTLSGEPERDRYHDITYM